MALLTEEQSDALGKLTQRERIDVVLNVLIRYLERGLYQRAFRRALAIVSASDTKQNAIEQLEAAIRQGNTDATK